MSSTEIWRQYEQGVDYKTRIGLYRTVDLNERFYAGEQWVGVPHEGLPTPVVNFIKYASAWKIAAVSERRLKMQFFAEGRNDGGDIGIYAKQVSGYCDMLWERLGMDYLTKEGLKQAAITGDFVQYFYWDSGLDTGQAVTGDIATQLVDNVSYYPGNPNTPDVQRQPYIILAFREMADKVREEARANGCDARDIVPDEETEYVAGDRGKVEMDGGGKCNVLLKMYRKDGSVWCEKVTRTAVVQPPKDTRLKRYPVALMNWETRKNCCHGVAEVTGLIPNQVYVNKIMALSQLSQMQMSFPKVVYDRTRIREWTNRVAGAIPVNGDIGGAAQYLSPPGVAYDAWRGLDVTLDKTMRMMGANDVTLGSIRNPDNTSAFIAARDAAMVPLQSHQERFHAFVEDVGLIWLDFIRSFYKGGRSIPLVQDGQRVFVPLPDDALDEYVMRLRVEVGPSTMWSEIQVLQTLDNLLKGGKLTLKQYLERLPDGHIPMKQELLEDLAKAEQAQQGGGAQGAGGGASQAGMAQAMMAKMSAAQGGAGGSQGMPQSAAAGVAGGSGGMPRSAAAGAAGGHAGPPLQGAGGNALAANAAAGQSGSEAMAAVLKLVQAGVQSGDVKAEAAQAIGKLAQGGAGADEIIAALKQLAQQGLVSEKFITALAQALGGMKMGAAQGGGMPSGAVGMTGGAAGGSGMPKSAAATAPAGVPEKAQTLRGGKARGPLGTDAAGAAGMPRSAAAGAAGSAGIPQSAALGVAGMPQSGAAVAAGGHAGPPLQGAGGNALAANAAGQPGVSGAAVRAAGAPKRAGVNLKRKADMAMGMDTGMRGMAARPQDAAAMTEALMALLKEGVQSGDVDADVPEVIGKLTAGGADGSALLEAMKQAMEAGKISPLMFAKAEKLLGAGNASAADEPTDRTQILRGNKNQLTR